MLLPVLTRTDFSHLYFSLQHWVLECCIIKYEFTHEHPQNPTHLVLSTSAQPISLSSASISVEHRGNREVPQQQSGEKFPFSPELTPRWTRGHANQAVPSTTVSWREYSSGTEAGAAGIQIETEPPFTQLRIPKAGQDLLLLCGVLAVFSGHSEWPAATICPGVCANSEAAGNRGKGRSFTC